MRTDRSEWRNERQRMSAMLAVKLKAAIKRPYAGIRMQLRHAHQARIRKRHDGFAVALQKFTDVGPLGVKFEIRPQKPDLNELEQVITIVALALQQKESLRDNSLAGQHGGGRVPGLLNRPDVLRIVADEQGDERPSVDEPSLHRP